MSDTTAAYMSADAIKARDDIINAWLNAKTAFLVHQERERLARAEMVELLFPTPKKGTQRFPLPAGYAVKLVQSYKYELCKEEKLDAQGNKIKVSDQVYLLEEEISRCGDEAPALLERLIKWTPELSGSEYEKLDVTFPAQAAIKQLIDAQLVIKPASPQVEFEEPKKK